MKSGFTLIELLIATMMAGMISVILLNGLAIINRGLARSDQQADLYMRVTTVQNQFERDLMGAFDPMPPVEDSKKKEAEKKDEKQGQQAAEKKQSPGEEEKEKPKQKKIEKVFLATAGDGDNLELLTFITNNPTKIFWGEKSGRAKPRIARVVYRLVPEKDKRDSFRILRQEADDLDFKAYEEREEKVRPYEVAGGIKECKLTYVWIEREEPKEKKPVQAGQPAKVSETGKTIVHREQSWDADKTSEKDSKRPRIPQQVQIELTAWEAEAGRHDSFVFTVPVFFTPYQEPEREQQQRKQPEKKEDKGQQQQRPGAPPGGRSAQTQIGGLFVGQAESEQLEEEHVQTA